MKHNRISSVYLCTRGNNYKSLYFKFRGEDSGFGYTMLDGERVHDLLQKVLSEDERTINAMIPSSFSVRKKKFTMERIK